MNVAELLAQIRSDGIKKEASAQGGFMTQEDEEMYKLAQDLEKGGRIFGRGVLAGMLEKLAEQPVGATGQAQPSVGNASNDPSDFKRIADKVMSLKGIESPGSVPSIPGSNPNVVAETTAPAQTAKPNPPEKAGG